jgi:hypothetical protein
MFGLEEVHVSLMNTSGRPRALGHPQAKDSPHSSGHVVEWLQDRVIAMLDTLWTSCVEEVWFYISLRKYKYMLTLGSAERFLLLLERVMSERTKT